MSTIDRHLDERLSVKVSDVLHAELRKSVLQRYAIELELRLARDIQRGLLPEQLPWIEGFEIIAFSSPTHFVGGDFYDVIPVADGFVAILGDVSGKGVAAALLGSMALGCLETQLQSNAGLGTAITSLNSLYTKRVLEDSLRCFFFD